jgi:hypothetical protein
MTLFSKIGISSAMVLGVLSLTALGGCATYRSAWVPVAQAHQTRGGLEVSTDLAESSTRYLARIEIHNGTRTTIHGPEQVVLINADHFIQPVLSAESLKEDIAHRAQTQAYYARNTWSSSYYGWPRRYYGRYGRRYRSGLFFSPYYGRRDWLEGSYESDRILSQAQNQISSLESQYLQAQDIPPGASVAGILQFAKSNPKDTADESLVLSMQLGKRTLKIPLQKDSNSLDR